MRERDPPIGRRRTRPETAPYIRGCPIAKMANSSCRNLPASNATATAADPGIVNLTSYAVDQQPATFGNPGPCQKPPVYGAPVTG